MKAFVGIRTDATSSTTFAAYTWCLINYVLWYKLQKRRIRSSQTGRQRSEVRLLLYGHFFILPVISQKYHFSFKIRCKFYNFLEKSIHMMWEIFENCFSFPELLPLYPDTGELPKTLFVTWRCIHHWDSPWLTAHQSSVLRDQTLHCIIINSIFCKANQEYRYYYTILMHTFLRCISLNLFYAT